MAVTVTVCGSAAYSLPATASGVSLTTPVSSVQVPVTNTSGDWMVAVCAWTQPSYATDGGSVSVADDAGNWWEPLGPPAGTSAASVTTRVSCWVAPAARAASFVLVAPTAPVQDLCVTVADVNGLLPWLTLTGVVTTVSAAGAVTLGLPAPPGTAFLVTGVTTLASAVPAQAGGGWTALAATGPTASLGLELNVSWQSAGGAVTSAWTSASSFMAGILGGFLVSGAVPAQPNPMWPATIAELAPGFGAQSSPDTITWVNATTRYLGLQVEQGRQFQLAELQAGQGAVTLDNPDGALLPPGTGQFTGITAGTPARVRAAWQGGAWQATLAGDGTHSPAMVSANVNLSTGGFATPGVTYTVPAWLACSVPYASGVTVQLNFYNGALALLATFTSAAVTGTVPVLATATGLAPAATAFLNAQVVAGGVPAATVTFSASAGPPVPQANVTMSGTGGWSAVAGTSAVVTNLAGWSPDVRGAPVVTPWSVPFAGYVIGWPQAWDANLRGVVQAPVTDAFGMLTTNLNPILPQEILNDAPYAYWPCTDAAGVTQAANMAGGFTTVQGTGNNAPLVLVTSKYGANGATAAFGQNGDAILGAQGTIALTNSVRVQSSAGMWGQALSTGGTFGILDGYCLACTDTGFPQPQGGFTVECWFQAQGPYPGNSYGPVILALISDQGVPWYLSVNETGAPNGLNVVASNGNSTISFNPNGYWPATGSGPLTHIAVTFTTTGWTMYVNGIHVPAGDGTFSPAFTTYDMISAGGTANKYVFPYTSLGFMQAFGGFLGHVAVFPRVLTPARINTHYQAGVAGMAGDATSTRLERLLQATPYLGRRCIIQESGGFVTEHVSCQDIGGQPASASLANISANVAPGNLWNRPNGDLWYQARQYSWDQAAKWVIGDNPAAGEIPYLGSITFGYDTQRVLNSIQLTQLDNQDVILPSGPQTTAVVQASQAQFGSLAYWVTGYLDGDLFTAYNFGPGLADLANWIANTQGRPYLRVGQGLIVDAASSPASWQFVLSAAPGDPVTVNRRPQGWAGEVVSVAGRLSQVQRTFTYGTGGGISAQVMILVDMMPEGSGLVADDPVRGQLTGSGRLGWLRQRGRDPQAGACGRVRGVRVRAVPLVQQAGDTRGEPAAQPAAPRGELDQDRFRDLDPRGFLAQRRVPVESHRRRGAAEARGRAQRGHRAGGGGQHDCRGRHRGDPVPAHVRCPFRRRRPPRTRTL
jgi:Concanavalin A-like lectin/glucanases superfamily